MSFCYSLFQKELTVLTFSDLDTFFSTTQEENAILEFKMGEVSLETIHKEVAAFANTQGGLLILGAPKEIDHPEKKNVKVCLGALTPCTKIPNPDTLVRSIASNISPSPTQIRVKEIQIEGGSVYIIDVAQSSNPPHQVNANGIYYIRMEREAKAAPHGIVEALFFRRQKSDLLMTPEIEVKPFPLYARLSFKVSNQSIIHADQIGWHLSLRGIRACQQSTNINLEEVNDDLTNGLYVKETVLVKGMLIQLSIDMALRFPMFYFHLSYYAKDSVLEHIEGLYDTLAKDYLYVNNSKHSDKNIGECENIRTEYELRLQKAIKVFLASGFYYNVLKPGAPKHEIDDLEYKIGNPLPDSLKLFLKLTNGFNGEIRECGLIVFSVEEIISRNKSQSYGSKEMRLEIGMINQRPVSLKFKKGIPHFEWFSREGYFRDNGASSIFDIFDDLTNEI